MFSAILLSVAWDHQAGINVYHNKTTSKLSLASYKICPSSDPLAFLPWRRFGNETSTSVAKRLDYLSRIRTCIMEGGGGEGRGGGGEGGGKWEEVRGVYWVTIHS